MRLRILAALAAAGLGIAGATAKADTILPAGTFIPVPVTANVPSFVGGPLGTISGSGVYDTSQKFSYTNSVYRDISGGIDLTYQITLLSGPDNLTENANGHFGNFSTSVSEFANGGTVSAEGATRDSADTVDFLMDLPKGDTTYTFVVKTDAPSYNPNGFFSVQDGGSSGNQKAFEVAAPAPASLWGGLALFGLVGGFVARRRLAQTA